MRTKIAKALQRHSIWLSLLFHILFLLKFTSLLMLPKFDPTEPPPSYVPSYVSNSDYAPPVEQQTPVTEKPKEQHKDGIEKQRAAKSQTIANPSKPKSPSFSRNQAPEEITDPNNTEPMHLIGESKIIKPLIKILGKALSQHLTYPRIAADFNLKGVVLVGFVLHPQGYITDTRVVKSSGAGVLDDAAREAVNAISPVGDVSEFVPKPEFLVVGIIFG